MGTRQWVQCPRLPLTISGSRHWWHGRLRLHTVIAAAPLMDTFCLELVPHDLRHRTTSSSSVAVKITKQSGKILLPELPLYLHEHSYSLKGQSMLCTISSHITDKQTHDIIMNTLLCHRWHFLS